MQMSDKSKKILSEISPGELLDKIGILEIKLEKVKDKNALKEIKKEYDILKKIQNSSIQSTDEIRNLFKSLKSINTVLWDVEDKLRIHEKDKVFDENFIELARKVYINNDQRAKEKLKINEILGSNIREVKQYVDYKI
tara:strand:+ start:2313 stop:2726 length:414 start_codon:yes stop_codon:yes gene_type:complete